MVNLAFFVLVLATWSTARRSSSTSSSFSSQSPDAKLVYQARRRPNSNPNSRPNIVLILTDDQDTELGSLQFMPKLGKHVGEQGATFRHGFVSTPMCCPSRSSLLTGLYVHNHHVFTNNDNCSSTYWNSNHEQRTFATYLSQSGYKTAYFGKYLNKYDGQRVPPGWDNWHGLVRNSRFYNYTLNENGVLKHHGFNYQRDYLPDIITNKSLEFISARSRDKVRKPFLAVLSYPGPHGPEDAAPQYSGLFFNVTTHHTPAYDFAPNPDKQWILRHTEKMLPIHKRFTDLLQTKRLQTLQSVDAAVEAVTSKLEELDMLENTYVFFTSDHGYHLGQFGLVKGKAFPFDFDTRVPLLVRGPGIAPNSERLQPTVNIDLAPTFLDIAGLEKPGHMDGKSLLPLLRKPHRKLRSAFLLERGKMTFERYAMVSINNEVLQQPPIEGTSLAIFRKNQLTKRERLEIECRKERYRAPCKEGQRWVCRQKKDGFTRIARCRPGEEKQAPCHCQPGEVFGWKYRTLEQSEVSMQKQFLKKHLELSNLKRLRPRFLKTLPGAEHVIQRRGRSVGDIEPGSRDLGHLALGEPGREVERLLESLAGEEIEEVDDLVEDIAEEIRDLHILRNATVPQHEERGCSLDHHRNSVVCSTEITSDKIAWQNSRSTIKHQIQQLRAQLNELKQIRKYLRMKRPVKERARKGLGKKKARHREVKTLRLSPPPTEFPFVDPESEVCFCNTGSQSSQAKEALQEERARKRKDRKLERLRQKEIKRVKKERKARRKLKSNDHCKTDVKMNCFSHDNEHWKTEPKWTEGPFCACTNSNNNTYWCVRNINETHNYLYCEYVTGMMTYFDLRVDPHQLRNLLHTLSDNELNFMHSQVLDLRSYSAERRFLERRRRARKLQEEEKKRKRWNRRKHRRMDRFLPSPKGYRRRG